MVVLFVIGFLGGGILAAFFEISNDKNISPVVYNENRESLAGSIKSISTANAESIIRHYLSVSSESIGAQERFFLQIATDLHFRENPDSAIAIIKGSTFLQASIKIQSIYIHAAFSSLANHYPERLPDYLHWLTKGNFPSKLLSEAISAFFKKLNEKDPKLSYRLLTNGSLKSFEKITFSSDFGTIRNLKTILEDLRKDAIGNIGLEDETLLFSELKSGNYWEHQAIFFSLSEQLSKRKDINVITWAKENLPEQNQKDFFSQLIAREKDSWQNAWNLAKDIGFENIHYWALNELIQKAAKEDTLAAMDMLENSLEGNNRELTLANVLLKLNEKETSEKMLPIIEGLPDGICKNQILPVFFEKYLKETPETAIKWILEKEDPNNSDFSRLYLNPALRKNSHEAQEIALLFWNNNESNQRIKESIVSYFARNNSSAGIEFMIKLPENEQIQYIKDFYDKVAWDNSAAALKSIRKNEFLGENKDELTKVVIQRASCTFPPTQLAVALKEANDPELTKYAAEQYLWAFDEESYNGLDHIERAFSSNLPEDFKKELSALLEAKQNGNARPENIGIILLQGDSNNW